MLSRQLNVSFPVVQSVSLFTVSGSVFKLIQVFKRSRSQRVLWNFIRMSTESCFYWIKLTPNLWVLLVLYEWLWYFWYLGLMASVCLEGKGMNAFLGREPWLYWKGGWGAPNSWEGCFSGVTVRHHASPCLVSVVDVAVVLRWEFRMFVLKWWNGKPVSDRNYGE